MNKIAENSEFWMGRDDTKSRTWARSFLDKMTWLIDLCIYNENRVLELGGNKKGKKNSDKKAQTNQTDNDKDNFEELNLSEFDEEFNMEDMKVVNEDEIPDE